MNKKQLYETPETELLAVRFEENFCGTNVPGSADGGFESEHDLGGLGDDDDD